GRLSAPAWRMGHRPPAELHLGHSGARGPLPVGRRGRGRPARARSELLLSRPARGSAGVNVHCLETVPSAALGRALSTFEGQFSYPLGPGATFRISHGEDYSRFFRAIGRATRFVAEEEGRVLGTLAVVIRRLARPDGGEEDTAYVADLKVAPEA